MPRFLLTSGAMGPADALSDTLAKLERCTRCGACNAGCPTYDLTRLEERGGRGRAILAESALRAGSVPAADVQEALSTCTGCGFCERVCPVGVPVQHAITMARSAGGRSFRDRALGWAMTSRTRMGLALGFLAILQRLTGSSPKGRVEGLRILRTEKGLPRLPFRPARWPRVGAKGALPDASIFLGCRVRHFFPELIPLALKLSTMAGRTLVEEDGPSCSGTVARLSGDSRTVSRLKQSAPRVHLPTLTLCAGCRRGFRDQYARTAEDLVDWLIEPLARRRPKGPRPTRVALHIPCSDRGFGSEGRPMRRLLTELEVPFTLLAVAECCGGAVPFSAEHRDLSLSLGLRLLAEAKDHQASVLVTSDAGCLLHLRECSQRSNGIPVLHGIELLSSLYCQPLVGGASC